MVNGLAILGHLEAMEDNVDGAIIHYEAALEIAEKEEDFEGAVVARWGLAEMARAMEDADLELQHLTQVMTGFMQLGRTTPEPIKDRLNELADTFTRRYLNGVDVFFSISQTPDAAGTFPDETTMYSNYLEQLQVADELLMVSHGWHKHTFPLKFRSKNRNPVIPHWQGEVDYAQTSSNWPCYRWRKQTKLKSVVGIVNFGQWGPDCCRRKDWELLRLARGTEIHAN